MTIEFKNTIGILSDINFAKLPYTTPVLFVFGQVAALTRAQSGCGMSDASNCIGGGGNMGVMMSDQNTKEKIVRIGDHPLGFGLYLFDYKDEFRQQWGQGRQFGVMAQEVENFLPDAVCVHSDGYRMVDYGMLGVAYPTD